MNIMILLVAVVIFACVICNRISSRFGIPMLLAFLLLGMFFGSDGAIRIPFDNFDVAGQICSVALIFIMFYGGVRRCFRPLALCSRLGLQGYFAMSCLI